MVIFVCSSGELVEFTSRNGKDLKLVGELDPNNQAAVKKISSQWRTNSDAPPFKTLQEIKVRFF